MVIGFDGSRALVSDRTGTENYSYQLLKALAKIDHENTYVVYLRSGTQGLALRGWPKNFQFQTVKWPRLWTQGGLALQTFKDHLDVLFVPAHTLPVIRRPGLETVVTLHDLGSEYLPKMHQLKQKVYLSFIQRYQLQTATKIIAVSNATREDLVERIGAEPLKVEVIYEGFDKKLFKAVKGDILVNSLIYYNLKPKTYYLFVGTVQPRKNLERVIRAFARFLEMRGEKWDIEVRNLEIGSGKSHFKNSRDQDIKSQEHPTSHFKNFYLVIAGSKGWLSDEIYNLPKKLGIEGRVKFLGYVPDKDLPALYSGAIALVFPSLFEGFGLPILEAQACGCPVITSNVSSMPEVAGKGALYVNPYNVDDIVKAMESLQVTVYRLQLVKKGFENIKRFSWEKAARETLCVLEEVTR